MSPVLAAAAQAGILIAALAVVHLPFGRYLAWVYTSQKDFKAERLFYRVLRVDPRADQRWSTYLLSVLGLSAASLLFVYLILRLQTVLPLSDGHPAVDPAGAWNTAVSFVANTNWQWYSGEQAVGALANMLALAVQNFVSAAVGMAVAIALVRGLVRAKAEGRVGNFFSDLVRSCVRVLLPLSVIGAIILIAAGVVQNFHDPATLTTLTGGTQHALGGPLASQEVIKELGTNGGGYFNANSAHPFEGPTPFASLFQIFLILLIPFSLPRAFGLMVGNTKQGWSILSVMVGLWGMTSALITWAEMAGPGLAPAAAGGAMEGKEQRFGEALSALFAGATTGTSTGAVNASHDSLTAPGGGLALFNILLGEVSPGGVGSGLYGMLLLAILTVFLAGLMVGRTPEYLGKKIRKNEITLVACYLLVMPALVLILSAITILLPVGQGALANSGPHGLSETLYAYGSTAGNNGSAFPGLTASSTFYKMTTGAAMLLGRFIPIALTLALAGRLATQKRVAPSAGTMRTDTPLFAGMLFFVTLVIAGLTYVPALALGPIAEALS